MVTINYKGRTANGLIQHIVGHFIAIKYNLKLIPIYNDTIKFGDTDNGLIGTNEILVNDNNWLDIVFGNKEYDSPHFYLDGTIRIEKRENLF